MLNAMHDGLDRWREDRRAARRVCESNMVRMERECERLRAMNAHQAGLIDQWRHRWSAAGQHIQRLQAHIRRIGGEPVE